MRCEIADCETFAPAAYRLTVWKDLRQALCCDTCAKWFAKHPDFGGLEALPARTPTPSED